MRTADADVAAARATGGFEFTHREFDKLWREGPSKVNVFESFAWFYAVNTGQISIRQPWKGWPPSDRGWSCQGTVRSAARS